MSYSDGWAAMNLEMPGRVPRTEYSAEQHWELIKAVTGIQVAKGSPEEVKVKAASAFMSPDSWNYDLFWSTLIGSSEFGNLRTSMGHAVYINGGGDFRDDRRSAFASPEEVLSFDPLAALGKRNHRELVGRFEDHYMKNCEAHPDGVNMSGVYISCMSGLIDLFGWDLLLLSAGTDPDAFGKLANRYCQWIRQYFDALGDSNVPVIMLHDDIVWSEGAFIHPDWYHRYIFPNYKKLLKPLLESGKKVLFTSDANYTDFIDAIADCGFHGFIMEPMTDMRHVAERHGQSHVFIGNADTRVLLSGTREEIRTEVECCMSIGKGCPGFFMAVGNHIPSNTPVENALYYNEVYEELSRR